MVASEILGRLGIELDIANKGREALEMVRTARGKYDAVLMDMQMPELDGLAATRAICEDPTLHDLPIIAMTANAMKADLDACLAAGMNDHITKPIDRRALLQTLRRWLPAPQEHRTTDPGASRTAAAFSPGAVDGMDDSPRLEGIDVAGSLARLGLEFRASGELVRFADSQGATIDSLRAAVASGDSALREVVSAGRIRSVHRGGTPQSMSQFFKPFFNEPSSNLNSSRIAKPRASLPVRSARSC